MTDEELLNLWKKKCLKQKLTPIALISYDVNGFPHVFSHHDKALLQKIYRHLGEDMPIGESTSLDGQEN